MCSRLYSYEPPAVGIPTAAGKIRPLNASTFEHLGTIRLVVKKYSSVFFSKKGRTTRVLQLPLTPTPAALKPITAVQGPTPAVPVPTPAAPPPDPAAPEAVKKKINKISGEIRATSVEKSA